MLPVGAEGDGGAVLIFGEGVVARDAAAGVAVLGVGAGVEQRVDGCELSPTSGTSQGRFAFAKTVHVRTGLEEAAQAAEASLAGGHSERGRGAWAGVAVDPCAALQ